MNWELRGERWEFGGGSHLWIENWELKIENYPGTGLGGSQSRLMGLMGDRLPPYCTPKGQQKFVIILINSKFLNSLILDKRKNVECRVSRVERLWREPNRGAGNLCNLWNLCDIKKTSRLRDFESTSLRVYKSTSQRVYESTSQQVGREPERGAGICVICVIRVRKIKRKPLRGRSGRAAYELKIENWESLMNWELRAAYELRIERWELRVLGREPLMNWKLKIENWEFWGGYPATCVALHARRAAAILDNSYQFKSW